MIYVDADRLVVTPFPDSPADNEAVLPHYRVFFPGIDPPESDWQPRLCGVSSRYWTASTDGLPPLHMLPYVGELGVQGTPDIKRMLPSDAPRTLNEIYAHLTDDASLPMDAETLIRRVVAMSGESEHAGSNNFHHIEFRRRTTQS